VLQPKGLVITHIFSAVISVFLLRPPKPLETKASWALAIQICESGPAGAGAPVGGRDAALFAVFHKYLYNNDLHNKFSSIAAMKDVGNDKA
jgi:hypothetical protein